MKESLPISHQILNDIISLIIPIYNTEKYLHRCLRSIINQTYQNIEIILIDDGSEDDSSRWLDEFSKDDSRIIVVHKMNGGLSEARNNGLALHTGQFIAFLDSDDYVQNDMVERLFRCIKNEKVDIAVCQWQWEAIDGKHTVTRGDIPEDILGYHTPMEFARFLYGWGGYCNGVVCSPWNKLFRGECFQRIRFSGEMCEEYGMMDDLLSICSSVYVIREQLYYYCENPTSLTQVAFNSKHYYMFDVLIRRIELFHQDKQFINHTKKLFCDLYIEYYYAALKQGILPYQNKSVYLRFQHEVKVNRKVKCRYRIFSFSPKLYSFLSKVRRVLFSK